MGQERLHNAVSRVRATLRRRGMSAQQLFSQRAGRGGQYLSVADLAAGLEQLGLLDAIEAGRFALAAAQMDANGDGGPVAASGTDIDLLSASPGGEALGVSLTGFLRLLGSVSGDALEDNVIEEATIVADVPTSPQALEETAIRFERGRWSVRLVPYDRFQCVWSSAKAPGQEGCRPFSIWRPDL